MYLDMNEKETETKEIEEPQKIKELHELEAITVKEIFLDAISLVKYNK